MKHHDARPSLCHRKQNQDQKAKHTKEPLASYTRKGLFFFANQEIEMNSYIRRKWKKRISSKRNLKRYQDEKGNSQVA